MENIKNIKYKKKYHKYKNKYHKIIQNHQMKGGASGISIVAVILTIIALLGLGTGIYMNNESIKTWFNSNYELIKKRIQNLRRAEEIDINKKQQEKLEVQKLENEIKKTLEESQAAKNIKKRQEFADNQILIDEAKAKREKEIEDEAAATAATAATAAIATPIQPVGVHIPDKEGLIFQNVETIKTIGKMDVPKTYYSELESILQYYEGKKKEDIELLINDSTINPNIKNVKVKLNPITQQKEVHWDFNTRHFYWTPNRNEEDKTVLIKYYPRFGHPNDISVYKLLTANKFALFEKNIEQLLPAKPSSTSLPKEKKIEMNKEKIALIKENQNNLDLLKEEGETIIREIIKTKNEAAINELQTKVSVDNYLETLSKIILKYTSPEQKQKQEKLKIKGIPGDGWCQFHSIIDQLLQTDKQKLEDLKNKYDDSSNYKNISNINLKTQIRQFIQKLINIINSNEDRVSSDDLVEDLLNIMINFIQLHGNFTIYECNNVDGNLGQPINFVEKIWIELFIKDDQNSFTIDEFDYELIKDAFFQFYKPNVNAKGDQWGGNITLTLIQFIFNLEINLYRNPTLTSVDKNNKLVLDQKECDEEDNSLIEINLLYSNNNHYDSVRQVTPK